VRVGDIVIVHWLDAVSGSTLEPGEDLPVVRAHTVGRLRKRTKTRIVVSGEWFDNGTERDVTTIPTVCITGIDVLREG
jgi:hypothetical protein